MIDVDADVEIVRLWLLRLKRPLSTFLCGFFSLLYCALISSEPLLMTLSCAESSCVSAAVNSMDDDKPSRGSTRVSGHAKQKKGGRGRNGKGEGKGQWQSVREVHRQNSVVL